MFLHFTKDAIGKTYFFCRFDDESSLIAENVVRSLIRQCLQAESLPPNIEKCLTNALDNPPIAPGDLSRLLKLAIDLFTEHYIVIDGIDECTVFERQALLDMLSTAMSSSRLPVKLLVSSRYGISEKLRSVSNDIDVIRVDEEKLKPDMATYIETTLDAKIEDHSFTIGDHGIHTHIRDALIDGAQGMYVIPQVYGIVLLYAHSNYSGFSGPTSK